MTTEMLARDPFELVAEREERVQKIKQALLRMNQQQLGVLIEHELRGMPLAHVARVLGITHAQAERDLAIVRQRLSAIPGV